MNVLEELYHGNICPNAKQLKKVKTASASATEDVRIQKFLSMNVPIVV